MSTGNANGLGHIRVGELRSACATFKVPKAHLTILDDPELQDGFRTWGVNAVCKHVACTVQSLQPDELVTFDAGGVSGHPNHTCIYHAVRHVMEARGAEVSGVRKGGGRGKRCRVYTLVTHPLLLKFSGPLGVMLITVLAAVTPRSRPGDRMFLTRDPTLCFRAMICHWSQFVWYRLLFVLFSTYTYANQLRPIGELHLDVFRPQ
ncbi:hypothetical protein VOLCADRAFT_104217 [Volvox carteri f. nagariensis]|uniref:N-acetylglucosaminylphosphatidylinositol deacetylase n=1 Tax=Volvox carteri f. nagariensis TaxID=3068 RepID=D8TS59_VOLCA|nr:uncharacterized protein VOLCADRAFT_104217 [Volvox carteri f. nagariensis]EFJ49769.1 hypothetical protein VOLCADRAFT_104217 [Volvox carteri f. nagariensis]|eukprot:XP_002949276.1 hypothetical protein VOLCADRAFT_104217 [Volvox carteri f. nagariensis]